MDNRKKVEYRYYEIPKDEWVLPLNGQKWKKEYGEGRDKLHFHNYYEVGICHEGDARMILGEHEHSFYSGCVAVIPQNELHTTNTYGQMAYCEWMYFDLAAAIAEIYPEEDILRDNLIQSICKQGKILTPDQDLEKMRFLILSIFDEMNRREYMYREMVKHFLLLLVVEIIRKFQNKDIPERVSVKINIMPAIEYIKTNYASPVKIQTLASCCNMSESHFRKLFVKYMNMKPLDYLNFVRIQKSCSILHDTELRVGEIAERVGFESASSYIRNFKKVIGCTPYQWKNDEHYGQNIFFKYHVTALKGWME